MRRVLGAVKGWAVGEVDYEKEKVVTSRSKVGKIAPPVTQHLSGREGRLRAKGAEDHPEVRHLPEETEDMYKDEALTQHSNGNQRIIE